MPYSNEAVERFIRMLLVADGGIDPYSGELCDYVPQGKLAGSGQSCAWCKKIVRCDTCSCSMLYSERRLVAITSSMKLLIMNAIECAGSGRESNPGWDYFLPGTNMMRGSWGCCVMRVRNVETFSLQGRDKYNYGVLAGNRSLKSVTFATPQPQPQHQHRRQQHTHRKPTCINMHMSTNTNNLRTV